MQHKVQLKKKDTSLSVGTRGASVLERDILVSNFVCLSLLDDRFMKLGPGNKYYALCEVAHLHAL